MEDGKIFTILACIVLMTGTKMWDVNIVNLFGKVVAKAVVLCDLFIVHEIFYFCLNVVSIKTPTITIAFTNLNYSPLLLVLPILMSSINKGLCVSTLVYLLSFYNSFPDKVETHALVSMLDRFVERVVIKNQGVCSSIVLTVYTVYFCQCCWV